MDHFEEIVVADDSLHLPDRLTMCASDLIRFEPAGLVHEGVVYMAKRALPKECGDHSVFPRFERDAEECLHFGSDPEVGLVEHLFCHTVARNVG
jgi:hypothetical protein